MMTVKELTRDQLIELKENYLIEKNNSLDNFPSYNELANVDETISDEEIINAYDGVMFTNDDFLCSVDIDGVDDLLPKTIETFVMEGSEGKFLHINATEDGCGTWFDWTPSIWDAYRNDLEQLKDIAAHEFSNFAEGYPKFHKFCFTCKKIETVKED